MAKQHDTTPLDPIQMPPGFDELPAEERLFIFGNKGNSEMMAVYQATKIMKLHIKHDDCKSRIYSLEESRKHFKWVGGTILAILIGIKGFILVKVFG